MAIDTDDAEHVPATVHPNVRVQRVDIDGVVLNQTAVIGDDRGVILELIDIRQDYWSKDGVPYVYMGTCRPGRAKGWGMHKLHTDRYMVLAGEMLLVLFDDRDDSPTKGVVQEFYLTRDGLNQLTIPAGIWHAHLNVGQTDLIFANAPTHPFQHSRPDKWRLPLENDQIPYSFAKTQLLGW
jgi:dTDP-4-dehydrorhamnose 3,5-epimerase